MELLADDSPLRKTLRRAQDRMRRFGADVRRLGMSMMAVGGALAVPFILGTKAIVSFQEQMARVSTMLDDPVRHMAKFSKAIREMAIEFGQSTETLADGLYDILSAQIPVAQAMEVLREGTKAAVGGFTDAKTSISAIITLMNAYGDELDGVADASDFLFSVVKRGRLTYEELASNLGKVAPIAAASGVSLEEFGAVLALVTRGMPDTQQATTALGMAIMTFLKNTDDGKKAAAKLGIEMSSAGLKSQGLLYVIQQLAKVDPDTVAKVFPRQRALRGLIIAVKKAEELGVDIEVMTNRAGRAEEAYQKMAVTLGHAFRQIKQAAMENLMRIGEALAGSIGEATGKIKAFLRQAGEWISANHKLILTIGKVAGALLAGGGLLVALGALVTAVSTLLNPVTLIIAAVATLAGAAGFGALLSSSDKTTAAIKEQAQEADELMGRYEDLVGLTERTAQEELALYRVTERLKELFPEYAAMIDGTSESLEQLRKETNLVGQAGKKLSLREQRKRMAGLRKEYLKADQVIQDIRSRRNEPDRPGGFGVGWAEFTPGLIAPNEDEMEEQFLTARAHQAELVGQMEEAMGEIRRLRSELGELPAPVGPTEAEVAGRSKAEAVADRAEARAMAVDEAASRGAAAAEPARIAAARGAGQEAGQWWSQKGGQATTMLDRALGWVKSNKAWLVAATEAIAMPLAAGPLGIAQAPALAGGFAQIRDLLGIEGQIEGGMQRATSVAGTFGATAAWGLGTGDVSQQMLTAMEETAKNTERLREEVAQNQRTFS